MKGSAANPHAVLFWQHSNDDDDDDSNPSLVHSSFVSCLHLSLLFPPIKARHFLSNAVRNAALTCRRGHSGAFCLLLGDEVNSTHTLGHCRPYSVNVGPSSHTFNNYNKPSPVVSGQQRTDVGGLASQQRPITISQKKHVFTARVVGFNK